MTSYADKLLDAFREAEKINAKMWWDCVDPQYLSVDELRDYVAEAYKTSIALYFVDLEVDHVYGLVKRYDEGRAANIYIMKNIGPRWKRLVAVKEICHVVIDRDEDFAPDGWDTLQRLIAGNALDRSDPENVALRSEHFAEIVAWELMYPHENRRIDVKAIEEGKTTPALVAQRVKMPEDVVSFLLSGIWMETCDRMWKLINSELHLKAMTKIVAAS